LREIYQAICDYLQVPIGAEPDHLYPFDMVAFCQRFSFSPSRAWYAIQFLEREHYWTMIDTPRNLPRIQLTSWSKPSEEFQESEPEDCDLLQALWRWRGDLYDSPVPLSTRNLSLSLGMDESRLMRRLDRAAALGLFR